MNESKQLFATQNNEEIYDLITEVLQLINQ